MTKQSSPPQHSSDEPATREQHDHPGLVAELARQVKQTNETDARKAILEDSLACIGLVGLLNLPCKLGD